MIYLFILLFALWKLYFFLFDRFDGHWLVPALFVIFLIASRVGLFFYRRSKGIRDTYLND